MISQRGLVVRSGWLAAAALAFSLLAPPRLAAMEPPVPVLDLHVDLPYRSFYKGKPFSRGSGQFVADSLTSAGVQGVVLPLFVPESARPLGRTLDQLELSYAHVFRSILETRPYSLPGCSIRRAAEEPRPVSTWLAFEGAGPLADDLSSIRRFALRGVRLFGLVHSVPNALATSSGRKLRSGDPGLTEIGRNFVRNVAKVGGLVDVSHASDKATNETIALSRELGRPVIATHSNARSLAPHPRNLTDDQIRGIAESGGVVGVNFHRPFLASSPGAPVTIRNVVEQVRWIRKIGGLGAVAIGSDFEGGISAVPELSDATRFQRLADELRKEGLSKTAVRQVLWGNAYRVLCERAR